MPPHPPVKAKAESVHLGIATQRLRILIVTPSLPYPLIWGFGIRVYQILTYLAQRHDVSLVAYGDPRDQTSVSALRRTGATIHPVFRHESTTRSKRRAQLTSLFTPVSYQRQSLESPAFQATLDRLRATQLFDIIHAESSQMCGFNLGSDVPLLLDEHNIEYELLYRTFQTERSPLRKLFNWVEYRKFKSEEMRSWKRASGCILTSDREEAIVRQTVPSTPTLVVPNGVDTDTFQAAQIEADPNSIVFLGVMHYRPNVDAALYFAREILPHVLRERPHAVFTIVGGGAPEELRRLAGPHVVLTDTVPDTRPYVSRAGAFVVPLRMGSGTRLKVLEGLAMNRAVVSTSLGCEGIDVVDGEHLLVADESFEFARRVVQVLGDPQLANNLGRHGRTFVESRYSWQSLLRPLDQFMLRIVGGDSADTSVRVPPLAG